MKASGFGSVPSNLSSSVAGGFEEFPERFPAKHEAVPGQHLMQGTSVDDPDDAAILSNEERALRMKTVLGPDSFNGTSRWTPAASLVVTLCDGSYKALKDLKRQGVEDDDLPSHYPKDCVLP